MNFDANDIPKLYWHKSWKIPGTPWVIVGYSRAAYRTGFFIKDLNLMLDAGPQRFDRPEHIMITHTHGDHIAQLPFTLIGVDQAGKNYQVQIYGPAEAKQYVEKYVNVLFETNAMIPPVPQEELDQFYLYRGLTPHKSFDVTLKNEKFVVEVFECEHRIPTISYGFTQIKKKLLSQYEKLLGKELAALRQQNIEVSGNVLFKRFAYVCDTTIRVFELNPTLLQYPVIMIECTYTKTDDEDNSVDGKSHIYWKNLQRFVIDNPNTQFMLFHFSRRYKDSDIAEYFESEKVRLNINNMHYWA